MSATPRRRNYDKRSSLLEEITSACPDTGPFANADDLATFIHGYYRNISVDDVRAASAEDLAGAALSHARLARTRRPDEHKLRIYNPQQRRDGWRSDRTIVELVHANMPFLVDSLSMAITRLGFSLHLTVHPLIHTERGPRGRLLRIAAQKTDRTQTESFIRFEIGRESRRARLEALEAEIEAVLRDVRAAVAHWKDMRALLLSAADELEKVEHTSKSDGRLASESVELLRWMAADHFTFLSYREYRLRKRGDETVLAPVAGTALGVQAARGNAGRARPMTPEMIRFARSTDLLIITKANSRATVHRPSYLDYIGVKRFNKAGEAIGEHRFLGLFTSVAYSESPAAIPLLRMKVQRVLDRSGLDPQGHRGKALMHILNTYPRDELFQSTIMDLSRTTNGILNLQDRRRVKLFVRRDTFRRFFSCLVYVPRDKYNTVIRQAIENILVDALEGTGADANVQLSESALARVHILIRTSPEHRPKISVRSIEASIAEAVITWQDRLREALVAHAGEQRGAHLFEDFGPAFPLAYEEDVGAEDACNDIDHLVKILKRDSVTRTSFDLREYPGDDGTRRLHFRVYRTQEALPLSDALPLLENLGVRVINERPYRLRTPGTPTWIQDFALAPVDIGNERVTECAAAFADCFAGQLDGRVEADRFNQLVIRAGLDSRQVTVVRAYAKYLLQLAMPFSQTYVEEILLGHASFAAALVAYFEAKFDPALSAAVRSRRLAELDAKLGAEIGAAATLDADRLLRAMCQAAKVTLRTNYYCRDARGAMPPAIALKFDTANLDEAPLPRPQYEIFVYSTRVEGVHLRAGKVARGGLRWSDRREDFRTEVLGLMKAQTVKNTIIVPTGAKGGFYPKRLPDGDRTAVMKEVVACYRIFVGSMLGITDNLVEGEIMTPENVVRHDDPDPYLVVAADKGTATFSDIANALSDDAGFWLGDAFASGGSAGYDHKKMAITARGAWEAVKRHFREIGTDTQSDEFTVAGIGDMAGDVFGNGMLLSDKIRLVAAFNHRHIFIDPDPDAETSFRERKRLFGLAQSSWTDYDPAVLSSGGGIFERSAKVVPLSPEARRLLGIGDEDVSPPQVIRHILRMEVDLLWNGGIGTYVKATGESHADVGDRSNNDLRVDARELRCKVVGEGGNLGLTQLARIEYAAAGGRINTDFIDNSAGVDSSDREVNIKIMLRVVMEQQRFTLRQRNKLLAEMTDEVAALVLRNNYLQTQSISMMQARGVERLNEHRNLIHLLERTGMLDRAIEFLPDEEELDERRRLKRGLTRPEIAVILSYAKLDLYQELIAAPIPVTSGQRRELVEYFPKPIQKRFAKHIPSHRLATEILMTLLTNSIVNRMGPAFARRAAQDTGYSIGAIARSYVIARELTGVRRMWAGVEKLDNTIPADMQYAMLFEISRRLRHACYWLLKADKGELDIEARVSAMQENVNRLRPIIGNYMSKPGAERLEATSRQHQRMGVPEAVARDIASLSSITQCLEIVDLAGKLGCDLESLARVYFGLGERMQLDWVRLQVDRLQVDGRWQARARGTLRDNVLLVQRDLTQIVHGLNGCAAAADSIDDLFADERIATGRVNSLITQMRESRQADFATLSVAVDELRSLTQLTL